MTQYDQMNRPVCVQTFAGGSTAPSPTSSCPASGVTSNSQYSYTSYTTTLTDAVGNSRTNATDGLGRLTSVTENSLTGSPVTSYTYNALDHLTGVSQASTSRSFVYDSLGRLSSATNPESGLTCYGTVSGTCNPSGGYDGNGNLLKRTDANSVLTTMTYDSLNRILGKSYSGSAAPAVTYDYDTNHSVTGDSATNYKAGRLTQVSSSVSGTVFRYDALGQVHSSMQTTGSNTYPFLYGYEPVGLTSETYPSGRVVTTAYNDAGRISQVSGAYGGIGSEYESSYIYEPNGALQQVTRGGNLEYSGTIDNGLVETRSYNDRWQTTSVGASLGSTTLLNLSYYYCGGTMVTACTANNGNLQFQYIQRPGVNIVQSYLYDGANRLTGAGECDLSMSCTGTWSQTFCYDANGNRSLVLGSGTYGTNTTNPVWTATVSSCTTSTTSQYTANNQFYRGTGDVYDSAGNETSVASASAPNTASNTMAYDGENRMVTGNFAGTGNVYYTYDVERPQDYRQRYQHHVCL